jgi:hypothetical protein
MKTVTTLMSFDREKLNRRVNRWTIVVLTDCSEYVLVLQNLQNFINIYNQMKKVPHKSLCK